MPCGSFVFTPKPLVLDVIIQDPKAENGKPFRYPDREIDQIHYRTILEEVYKGMFDPLGAVLPKYCCQFGSGRFTYPSNASEDPQWIRDWNEKSVRALARLTAFIRKNVKETGEFWFAKQWMETVVQRPEDMTIIEMNVDDLKFRGDGVDSFEFKKDTFYKFVDD